MARPRKNSKKWQLFSPRRRAVLLKFNKKLLRKKRQLTKVFLKYERALAVVGLFVGIQLVLAMGWYHLYSHTVLSFHVSPVVTQDVIGHQPTRVVVEGVGIDLPLLSVEIQNGIWPTSLDSANHLSTSATPLQSGNIVIYAHNRPHLFRPLHEVEIGDEIVVKNQDDRAFSYQVESIHVVSPDQIDLVLPTNTEVLTIYTCTGWFDSKRLVIRALPV